MTRETTTLIGCLILGGYLGINFLGTSAYLEFMTGDVHTSFSDYVSADEQSCEIW